MTHLPFGGFPRTSTSCARPNLYLTKFLGPSLLTFPEPVQREKRSKIDGERSFETASGFLVMFSERDGSQPLPDCGRNRCGSAQKNRIGRVERPHLGNRPSRPWRSTSVSWVDRPA